MEVFFEVIYIYFRFNDTIGYGWFGWVVHGTVQGGTKVLLSEPGASTGRGRGAPRYYFQSKERPRTRKGGTKVLLSEPGGATGRGRWHQGTTIRARCVPRTLKGGTKVILLEPGASTGRGRGPQGTTLRARRVHRKGKGDRQSPNVKLRMLR